VIYDKSGDSSLNHMKLAFDIGKDGGTLTIQREASDPRAKASGFTRDLHGWGAEIHLMGVLAKKLNALGFNLLRKNMGSDGHMYGTDHTPYIRVRNDKTAAPHIYIYDGEYALRLSSQDYNARKPVQFNIEMDVFEKQSDCYGRIAELCRIHNIECKVTEPAK
jgi:hypothetical protein